MCMQHRRTHLPRCRRAGAGGKPVQHLATASLPRQRRHGVAVLASRSRRSRPASGGRRRLRQPTCQGSRPPAARFSSLNPRCFCSQGVWRGVLRRRCCPVLVALLTARGHACVYVWSAYRRHCWTRCVGWYQRWWTKNLSSCTNFLSPLPSSLSMITRLVASPLCAMHPSICREHNRSGFNSDIDQISETTACRPMPRALRA